MFRASDVIIYCQIIRFCSISRSKSMSFRPEGKLFSKKIFKISTSFWDNFSASGHPYAYKLVLNCSNSYREVVIGLGKEDFPLNKLPGMTQKSGFNIGLDNNGHITCCKKVINTTIESKQGDILGLGINFFNNSVFFTHNGVKFPISFELEKLFDFPLNLNELYPIGGI